jgi:hypothetical protein
MLLTYSLRVRVCVYRFTVFLNGKETENITFKLHSHTLNYLTSQLLQIIESIMYCLVRAAVPKVV